jgi:hypothetical protein
MHLCRPYSTILTALTLAGVHAHCLHMVSFEREKNYVRMPEFNAAVVSARLPVGAHRHGNLHETSGSKYLGIAHDRVPLKDQTLFPSALLVWARNQRTELSLWYPTQYEVSRYLDCHRDHLPSFNREGYIHSRWHACVCFYS